MGAAAVPAKERALRLLTARGRSREELRRRLTRAGYEDADIATALDDLEAVGLVDDERFARDLAAHQVARRGSGKRVAEAALRRAGIAAEVARTAVEEAAPDQDEEARAEALARTRLSRLASLDPATASRRLLGFLVRRGYDGATARAVCRRVLAGSEDP